MKRFAKILLALLLLAGAIAAVYYPLAERWRLRSIPKFLTAEASTGRIIATRNSTGTVKPVTSVLIGSFVSGPVAEIFADFNDQVIKGQLLAKIDPRIYEASFARDQAALDTQLAEVERVKANLQQAINDERRSQRLRERNKDYISDSEIDQYRFSRAAFEAQLMLAEAAVKQARANLRNSEANLGYTEIRAPVDGIVIDRKIDPGQTLASSFQTPELFTIAPDMDRLMHVFASVDEADIGLIRRAHLENRPVRFTVDAYPDETFDGTIHQIRKSSTTTDNVVTYPVVIAAPNTDMKLLPGMTASIEFEVDLREDVLMVPNATLLFYPPAESVRAEDRYLVAPVNGKASTSVARNVADPSRRHVWAVDGERLRAIPVRTGITDGISTEVLEGDVKPGQSLVTGIDRTARGF